MTKELREKIANRLALHFFVRCLRLHEGVTVLDEARREADQIHAIYKEALPEWARANKWVKLADDQSLPVTPLWKSHRRAVEKEVIEYMLKAGWRKVFKEK